MTHSVDRFVARLVTEYYDWRVGAGGMSSDEILSLEMTLAQRKEILEAMDDVNIICGLANLAAAGQGRCCDAKYSRGPTYS